MSAVLSIADIASPTRARSRLLDAGFDLTLRPMRSVIDLAAERGPFLDQSQSLNLFMESPNIGQLSSMYMYAWKRGLKSTYYLRSRPATRITKTTVEIAPTQASLGAPASGTDAAAVACSLENPGSCEACQ